MKVETSQPLLLPLLLLHHRGPLLPSPPFRYREHQLLRNGIMQQRITVHQIQSTWTLICPQHRLHPARPITRPRVAESTHTAVLNHLHDYRRVQPWQATLDHCQQQLYHLVRDRPLLLFLAADPCSLLRRYHLPYLLLRYHATRHLPTPLISYTISLSRHNVIPPCISRCTKRLTN